GDFGADRFRGDDRAVALSGEGPGEIDRGTPMKCILLYGMKRVEIEADTVIDLFRQVAAAEDLFAPALKCGRCGGERIMLPSRRREGHEFFEANCLACGARLCYGVHKQGGTLFARRTNGDGVRMPDGGWHHYEPGK